MCRYAYHIYKAHFACFDCRKAFKKTAIEDYVKQKGLRPAYTLLLRYYSEPKDRERVEGQYGTTYEEIRARYIGDVSSCPQCGATMAAMGLDFKGPKQRDAEAWLIVQELFNHGFNFHSCGCGAGYTPPTKRSDLPAWLEVQAANSFREKLRQSFHAQSPSQRATAS